MVAMVPIGAKDSFRAMIPGIAVASCLAVAASFVAALIAPILLIPALLIAVIAGIALNPFLSGPRFGKGLHFCVSRLLRIAVALLGLRVALGDIFQLGWSAALVVIAAMAATIFFGLWFAQFLGLSRAFGALAGVATSVCGASAALATSIALPDYKGKEADTAFVIIAVNLLSTVAMFAYPRLGHWLGFDETQMGLLLGGTIHDVAQVVGAGYSDGENIGAISVIVKLFRVLLLLPVILIVGRLFVQPNSGVKVSAPVFAFAFLVLCVVNSLAPLAPSILPGYSEVKFVATYVSNWGLLIAIAALGINTSLQSITKMGLRQALTVTGTTMVILAFVVCGVVIIR